jgi:serine/threonine-protein kinase
MKRAGDLGVELPLGHAVQISCSVAAALEYAHERRGPDGHFLGVVHRDVSPSNIIISYDGAVKLLDFGVAKAATSTVKTRTGALRGKVSYMSPEQARGAALDRRTDVFALGIVLWEMVTGQRLFKEANDLATIHAIINDPIPPAAGRAARCPAQLDGIIGRALARDPDRRYQTARELQHDLEELATEQRIKLSSMAISDFMNGVFADEVDAWKSAQSAGITLSEHVVATGTSVALSISSSAPAGDGDVDDPRERETRRRSRPLVWAAGIAAVAAAAAVWVVGVSGRGRGRGPSPR